MTWQPGGSLIGQSTTAWDGKRHMTNEPLTVHDFVALAEVASAAQQSAPIKYLGIAGEIISGTARCFTRNTSGAFLTGSDDVRDAYLWVTLDTGFEVFLTVRYLMGLVHGGGFIVGGAR